MRQIPQGIDPYLSARSLKNSFPVLNSILQQGMKVLDVGCGPGSITRDIAEKVGPTGAVLGIDQDPRIIEQARFQHKDLLNLKFAVQEASQISERDFDVVCAARVLLWIPNCHEALNAMWQALKPGGLLVVLDNTSRHLSWDPPLPDAAQRYFAAYRAWRQSGGLNNGVVDVLPEWLHILGFERIQTVPSPETTSRDHPLFEHRAGMWTPCLSGRAAQVVRDGFFSEPDRQKAEEAYRKWLSAGQSMTTHLATVMAQKPF